MRTKTFAWTSAECAIIHELWPGGASGTMIANRINAMNEARDYGARRTRSAVLGQIHRMGLNGKVRLKPSNPSKPLPRALTPEERAEERRMKKNERQRKYRERQKQGNGSGARGSASSGKTLTIVPKAPPAPPAPPPEARNVDILELGPNECRFATSDHYARPHLFCGAATKPGSQWCEHHRDVVIKYAPGDEDEQGGEAVAA
jgi:GcrA cell cycle regulator